jgi:hypothetical protein
VVECTGFENRRGGNPTVSSNLTLSAIFPIKKAASPTVGSFFYWENGGIDMELNPESSTFLAGS